MGLENGGRGWKVEESLYNINSFALYVWFTLISQSPNPTVGFLHRVLSAGRKSHRTDWLIAF